jgi:aryl-alcohol dehydrogenase-like predicted oxidoreductase
MEYRRLGSAGLKVSALGLGTNNFGERLDEAASVRVVHAALELGINFIDTANRYGGGQSEEFIGKALKGKRKQALIGTKF